MKIYTKTGDAGETSLFGGQRVPKDAVRIEAYGSVDELNAFLGTIRSMQPRSAVEEILSRLQNDLFVLGADLATPLAKTTGKIVRIHADAVADLEGIIDRLDGELKPLTSFILPGGTPVGAQLHVARTVCRRAERFVVRLSCQENIGALPLIYLNRLSDLLFVLARFANHIDGVAESSWSA